MHLFSLSHFRVWNVEQSSLRSNWKIPEALQPPLNTVQQWQTLLKTKTYFSEDVTQMDWRYADAAPLITMSYSRYVMVSKVSTHIEKHDYESYGIYTTYSLITTAINSTNITTPWHYTNEKSYTRPVLNQFVLNRESHSKATQINIDLFITIHGRV